MDNNPRTEPKVCRMCFSKVHCRGVHASGRPNVCECPCRELKASDELLSTQEWNKRQAEEAGIRARMRDVEGKVIQ